MTSNEQPTMADTIKAIAGLAEIVNRTMLPSIAEFAQALSQVSQTIAENILDAFSSIFHRDWHRRSWEDDSQYAKRLADDGWLDNPDARWEYQKIVWGTPVRLIRELFDRGRND